jgi:hypothetical protein
MKCEHVGAFSNLQDGCRDIAKLERPFNASFLALKIQLSPEIRSLHSGIRNGILFAMLSISSPFILYGATQW